MIMFTSNFILCTDIQNSEEEGNYARPKRVKSVPCISFRFKQFINTILICRCLTDDDKVLQGLTTGRDTLWWSGTAALVEVFFCN